MTSYLKIINYCLTIFLCFSIIGCKEDPESPLIEETPPIISVQGQNPLKTGIYCPFVNDTVKISTPFGLDSVWNENNIDTSLLGHYQITYYARSLSGMISLADRNVWTVVKPESMKGIWNIALYYPAINLSLSFVDSLDVENKNLIISNLNDLKGAKTKLSLASDLQDSVYIAKQFISDSLYTVFGNGTINETATEMILFYSTINDKDTLFCRAIYSRDSINSLNGKNQYP